MHQIFATLFSLLVALCQHTSLTARPVEAAELPGTVITSTPDAPHTAIILPNRYELARQITEDGSYAGSACGSCRATETSISYR